MDKFASEKSEFRDSATGARIIQWTRGPQKDQHLYFTSPSVTNDDRWLVFISDRDGHPNLYAIDRRDGTIRRRTRNADGLLRGYVYPQGGMRGLAKASPCLDAANNRLYYIHNDRICVSDLDADADDGRAICELPAGWYTAFNHVSPDGRTLCVPIADGRAFAEPMQTQWEQLRRVPEIMTAGGMVTRILLIDTQTGSTRVAAEAPFWVSHVQFDPAGTGRVIFNKEGQYPTTGRPLPDRVWCLETSGAFRPIAPEAADEWRSHENWSSDGKTVVYHGCLDGRMFVAARTWEGALVRSVSIDGIKLYHATSAIDGRRLFIDKPDGFIAVVDPDAPEPRVTDLCRHDSTCRDQDAHVHPITTLKGRSLVFTSDRSGNCDVFELMLGQARPC